VRGNESFNILNLKAVEHALLECIQLLIDFWREKVPRNKYQTRYNSANRASGYIQEKEHISVFTIGAEIHVRSLVNFCGQYADRHMNLKFVRRGSEREREIRQFVIVKNTLMSVFNAPALLLTMNLVITLSK